MSARRVRLPLLLAAALGATACGPAGAARPSSAPVPPPSLPLVTPAPSPHGDTLTSGASIGYDGFREWATGWGGIAVVRIVGVGPLRWTTRDGARPSEGELHGAPPGLQSRPGIGRLISVSESRLPGGRWLGSVDGAVYWGGWLGLDTEDAEIPLPEFTVGETAIAFTLPQEGDLGNGGAHRSRSRSAGSSRSTPPVASRRSIRARPSRSIRSPRTCSRGHSAVRP